MLVLSSCQRQWPYLSALYSNCSPASLVDAAVLSRAVVEPALKGRPTPKLSFLLDLAPGFVTGIAVEFRAWRGGTGAAETGAALGDCKGEVGDLSPGRMPDDNKP